jgi:hypothetical protein
LYSSLFYGSSKLNKNGIQTSRGILNQIGDIMCWGKNQGFKKGGRKIRGIKEE